MVFLIKNSWFGKLSIKNLPNVCLISNESSRWVGVKFWYELNSRVKIFGYSLEIPLRFVGYPNCAWTTWIYRSTFFLLSCVPVLRYIGAIALMQLQILHKYFQPFILSNLPTIVGRKRSSIVTPTSWILYWEHFGALTPLPPFSTPKTCSVVLAIDLSNLWDISLFPGSCQQVFRPDFMARVKLLNLLLFQNHHGRIFNQEIDLCSFFFST